MSAKTFVPHSFSREILVDPPVEIPTVHISPLALSEMHAYVSIASKEVGWLGLCDELEDGDYLIERTFLLEQEVSSAETDISDDGVAKLAQELLAAGYNDDDLNRLLFWGHSHVNMDTSPSGQDDKQMEVFRDSGAPYFIRAILNKRGKIQVDVYDYSQGLTFVDIEWTIHHEKYDVKERIEKDFKAKVSEAPVVTYRGGGKHARRSYYEDMYGNVMTKENNVVEWKDNFKSQAQKTHPEVEAATYWNSYGYYDADIWEEIDND